MNKSENMSKLTTADKQAYNRAWDRYSASVENKYRSPIRKALNDQVDRVVAYFDHQGLTATLQNIDAIILQDPIRDVLFTLYTVEGTKGATREAKWLNRQFGGEYKDFPFFTRWFDVMVSFFRIKGAEQVVNITDTTKEILKAKLIQATDQNLTIPETRDLLRMPDINKRRANVIARTEIISTLNYSSHAAVDAAPVEFTKEWIATNDSRTRKAHIEMNGQKRDLEDKYSNGGMYPGDPNLSAKERIQCRCVEIHEAKRDGQGRLVRKQR